MNQEVKKIEVKDGDEVEVEEPIVLDTAPPAVSEAIKVDKVLQETLIKAYHAKKYLICITRGEGDKLEHQTFTLDFKRGDIAPSLDEWSNLLMKQIQE